MSGKPKPGRPCSQCGAATPYTQTKSTLCLPCRRAYEKNWRLLRSQEGRQYSKRPEVRYKNRSRQKTYAAIRSGLLIRQNCEVCGDSRSFAHHEDYAQPLKIRWLCRPHHEAVHARKQLKTEGRQK